MPDETLAEMNLYAGLPNWIGYFLPYTMRVGDAFASIWNNISEIRHQDWAIANPSGNQPPVPDYMLNFTISYGDMVIVKVFENCTFYWPSNSNPETPLSAPETNYFSYEEKADYASLLANQMCSLVKWYDVCDHIVKSGVTNIIEVGPGMVLSKVLKRATKGMDIEISSVRDAKTFAKFMDKQGE